MVEFLAMQVRLGNITVDKLPVIYRDSVKALLEEV